jgi:hypothetical protein
MSDSFSDPKRAKLPPAFIVGCPRSGTTLLASLCDRHSQVAVTPESHFFSKSYFRNKISSHKDRLFNAAELSRRFAESQYTRDLNLSSRELLAATGESDIRLDDFYRIAMETFVSARGKVGWMEKTPAHLLFADRIFDWYPQARMICIFRDGRDVALSLRKLPWSITPVRHYATLWRQSAIAMLRCQRQWPENFLAIRYESLLTDPKKTLSSVMNFVGLDFEPQQLDPSLGTGVVPEWEMLIKKNVFAGIDPSRVYAWKRTATRNQLRAMHSMMDPLLEQLGYEPYLAGPSTWPVRAYDATLNGVFRIAFSYKLYWLRWWVRVLLNRVIPVSPYASLSNFRTVQRRDR